VTPFREVCGNVKLVAHFNMPATVDNPRSAERDIPLRVPDTSRLAPDFLFMEPQRHETVQALFELFKKHDLRAENTLKSHINLLHGYHSLHRAWELAELAGFGPGDIALLIRPDLEYVDRWPAARLVSMILDDGYDLITPDWHDFGGLNDRMAVANYSGTRVYARRWHLVERIVAENTPRRSEEILARCAQLAGLKVSTFSARAVRVRADGRVQLDGFQFPRHRRLRWKLRALVSQVVSGRLRSIVVVGA
jgi:hypothetical protein